MFRKPDRHHTMVSIGHICRSLYTLKKVSELVKGENKTYIKNVSKRKRKRNMGFSPKKQQEAV